MTYCDVTMAYMTSYWEPSHRKRRRGNVSQSGFCRISPSCQLNMTFIACYIVSCHWII